MASLKRAKKNKSASAKKGNRSRGRPEVVLTDDQLQYVRSMSGLGMTWKQISEVMMIPERTLQRKASQEFREGGSRAIMEVSKTLFEQAKLGKNIAATIFFLKARAGWKETQRVEHGVNSEALEGAVAEITARIRRVLPRCCPGCKTRLNLGPVIAKELMAFSEKLERKEGEAVAASRS